MEASDWSEAAGSYRQQVASVFDLDRKGLIRSLIRKHGAKGKSCIDLGCGPGRFLPLLCDHFGEVHACDYSEEMLDRARGRAKRANLDFERLDLRKRAPGCAPADLVLCVNVLLHPDLAAREAMWRHLAKSVGRPGVLLLVVPSLESALLSRHRLVEWNLRSGVAVRHALRRSFDDDDPDAVSIARGGVLDAGGTRTKHYLKEEIECLAARLGLGVTSCEKIEYGWGTEFHRPPRWMKAPYPWDWLAVLRNPE